MIREEESTLPTRTTFNAALAALSKCRKGQEAVGLLHEMKCVDGVTPNGLTYHHAIQACLRQGDLESAHSLLQNMTLSDNLTPSQATFNLLVSAFGKVGRWEDANRLEQQRSASPPSQSSSILESPSHQSQHYFQHWDDAMLKVQKGKAAWWVLGHYNTTSTSASERNLSITVGLHPHRNPSRNGIQLCFYEHDPSDPTPTKLGYLLMINHHPTGNKSTGDKRGTSTFLGMKVTPNRRKGGLSKVFMAVWLALCLESGIKVRTGEINKPLLSLLLRRFGFLPEKGGLEAQIAIPKGGPIADEILLYSPRLKSLKGAFSPWDLKNQKIRIVREAPERGETVHLHVPFGAPEDMDEMKLAIHKVIGGGDVGTKYNDTNTDTTSAGQFSHGLTPIQVEKIMLGIS